MGRRVVRLTGMGETLTMGKTGKGPPYPVRGNGGLPAVAPEASFAPSGLDRFGLQ